MKKIIFFVLIMCTVHVLNAQKTLSEIQTKWVTEANEDMQIALSDPEMSDSERLKTFQKAGRTQKRYGQPHTWPEDGSSLEIFMNEQFEQCKNEIAQMSSWGLELEKKNLTQKMKLINSIQIEVVEEQIQLLIPGSTPVQLTGDAINTVFGINIAEGINGGKRQDAKDLTAKFKKLAESKELIKHINLLVDNHTESLKMIDTERDTLHKKMLLWKKAYVNARKTTFTERGLEGAKLYKKTNENLKSHPLIGRWSYSDGGIIVTGYTFNPDNTAIQVINDVKYTGWTWEVQGNTLYMIGKNGKKNSWEYRIDNNQLYLTVEYNGQKMEGFPLDKK